MPAHNATCLCTMRNEPDRRVSKRHVVSEEASVRNKWHAMTPAFWRSPKRRAVTRECSQNLYLYIRVLSSWLSLRMNRDSRDRRPIPTRSSLPIITQSFPPFHPRKGYRLRRRRNRVILFTCTQHRRGRSLPQIATMWRMAPNAGPNTRGKTHPLPPLQKEKEKKREEASRAIVGARTRRRRRRRRRRPATTRLCPFTFAFIH
jgi:hypothetical protein